MGWPAAGGSGSPAPFPLSGGQPALCPALDPTEAEAGGCTGRAPLRPGLGARIAQMPQGKAAFPCPSALGSRGTSLLLLYPGTCPVPSAVLPRVTRTAGVQTGGMRESWGCPQPSGLDSTLPGSLAPQTWGSCAPPATTAEQPPAVATDAQRPPQLWAVSCPDRDVRSVNHGTACSAPPGPGPAQPRCGFI